MGRHKKNKEISQELELENLPEEIATIITSINENLENTCSEPIQGIPEEVTVITEVTPVKGPEHVEVDSSVFIKPEEKVEVSEFIKPEENKEPSVFVQETAVKEEKKPVFEAKKEDVRYYKIVFIDNKKKREIFTKKRPVINSDKLRVEDPFEKITLKENILNKKVLTLNCKLELDIKELSISLNEGVVISINVKETWMEVDNNTASKIFNERVLKVYRDLTAELPPVKPKTKTEEGLIDFI